MVDNEMAVKNFTKRKVPNGVGQISLDHANCRLKTAFRAMERRLQAAVLEWHDSTLWNGKRL